MHKIRMADVGDGLCCLLTTNFGQNIQIDWGSQQGGSHAIDGWWRLMDAEDHTSRPAFPEVFALSHFHTDHYNGLLQASKNPQDFLRWGGIKLVMMAGLPEMPQRSEFYLALFAMGARVFGSQTGHMEYDFLHAIHRLAGRGFRFLRLFQGDYFVLHDMRYQCIWPPRELESHQVSQKVARALDRFQQALQEDYPLAEIHRAISESRFFHLLGQPEDQTVEYDENLDDSVNQRLHQEAVPIPEPVEAANEALRGAANDLSLAFHAERTLLSLGDVSPSTLPHAVEYLNSVGARQFSVCVAPHHGTYWHKSLDSLRANCILVSNGPKLWKKYRRELASIGTSVRATYITGDIALSL